MFIFLNKKIELLHRTFKLFARYIQTFTNSIVLLWTVAPKELAFLTFTLLLQSLIPAIAIWINKQVVDTVTTMVGGNQEFSNWSMIGLVIGWVVAIFLQNFLPPYSEAAFGNAKEKLTAHINLLLIKKTNRFKDIVRFENSGFYDELQLIQEQVIEQPINLLTSFCLGFRESVTIITMFILLFPLGLWIPLLIVITTLPQTYFSFKMQWNLWEKMSEKSPQSRRMQYYSSIMLTDIYAKEVRLFNLGSFFTQRYIEAFENKYKALRRLRNKQAFFRSGLTVVGTLGNSLAFYSVVSQAFNGRLSPGNVLLFIQSLAYTQESLIRLVNNIFVTQDTLIFMKRLFEFLDSKTTLKIAIPGKSVPSPIVSGISFDNVSFSYPDGRQIFEKISFTLKPGQTIALVGENGAGKSTLIKLIARLYDPTGGKILIDGIDLKSINIDEWRSQISVVFQDFCRYSLSIEENIALGNLNSLKHHQRIILAAKKAGIADKIDSLDNNYQTLLGKQFNGTELSGGEWQKIAIARAFTRQDHSQILILDEPTAALDPRSEFEIYRHFSELVSEKTAILVTHRLSSVFMADLIMVMKAGKLIEIGTHEELLAQNQEYATLWNMQAESYVN